MVVFYPRKVGFKFTVVFILHWLQLGKVIKLFSCFVMNKLERLPLLITINPVKDWSCKVENLAPLYE